MTGGSDGRAVRPELKRLDEYDILSAVWILSSNDENAVMTYAAIRFRLGLPEEYPLEDLIHSRGDLFRKGVPENRLEEWKTKLREGKSLPSWMHATPLAERDAKIAKLSAKDCFRSQFRTGANAPQSPIEIIDWGLQHVDRLRRAASEVREEKARRWTGRWIPLASTLVALTAVAGSTAQAVLSRRAEADLKRYELSFAPRQQSYAKLMRAHLLASQAAQKKEVATLRGAESDLDATFYEIEPFLSDGQRDSVRTIYRRFIVACYRYRSMPRDSQMIVFPAAADTSRQQLSSILYPALFRDPRLPDGRL